MNALGMIEVKGRLGAIEGLDASLKAANVSLVNMIRVGGGLTTFLVDGDVGAVKAAIDAGATAAEKVCELISLNVIPRPDESLRRMLELDFDGDRPEPLSTEKPTEEAPPDNNGSSKPNTDTKATEEVNDSPVPDISYTVHEEQDTEDAAFSEELSVDDDSVENKTVGSLRRIARATDGISMTKEEIKFAKKRDLIYAIKETRKKQ